MIFQHLLVWATVWLSHVQAQIEPVLERSIVLNKAGFMSRWIRSSTGQVIPGSSANIFKYLHKPWKSTNGKSSSISRNLWIIWSDSIYLLVERSRKTKDDYSDLNLTHTIVKFTNGFWEMELNTLMGDVASPMLLGLIRVMHVCIINGTSRKFKMVLSRNSLG